MQPVCRSLPKFAIRGKHKATLYHCTCAIKNAALTSLSYFPLSKVIRVSIVNDFISAFVSLPFCLSGYHLVSVVSSSSADALKLTNGCICRLFVESLCCVEEVCRHSGLRSEVAWKQLGYGVESNSRCRERIRRWGKDESTLSTVVKDIAKRSCKK